MARNFNLFGFLRRGATASENSSMPVADSVPTTGTLDADAVATPEPSAALFGPTAHRAAGRGESNTRDWNAATQTADAELQGEREIITARARDLVRNNGFAAGLSRTEVDSVLGARGLRLSARPDYKALGKTKEWADQMAATMQSLWRSFAEDPLECDAAGLSDMTDQSTQHYLGTWSNGDSFALPIWRDRDDPRYAHKKWSLCFQGIEADRVLNPNKGPDTREMRGGIRVDEYGGYVAFNIAKTPPNDVNGSYIGAGGQVDTQEIPAYTDWGRRRVIHIIERRRFGQTRAAGVLTAVLSQFKSIDGYMDAAMKNHILNTLVAMLITTPLNDIADWFETKTGPDGQPITAYDQLANATKIPALKPGATLRLKPGEEAQAFSPNRPDAQIDNFINVFLREIAAACGSTYELLTKDFTKSNYSSIRAALVETWRYFSGKRYWLATCWYQRVYELLMEEAANDGRINAPDFYKNRHAYCRAEWLGAARGLVDPVRESTASVIRLENGLITYEKYFADEGEDWREQFEQQALEKSERVRLGLPILTGGDVAKAAASAPAPDDSPPPAPASPAAPNQAPPPPPPKPPRTTPAPKAPAQG